MGVGVLEGIADRGSITKRGAVSSLLLFGRVIYALNWNHGNARSAVAGTSVLGVAMADELRVMLEIGPKGKQVVAVAPDWPGLARGAKTEEAATTRLQAYLP